MATASIYSASDTKSSWGTWTKYFSFPISTINSALNNTSNVPANAKITGVTINVSVRYEVSGSARVYFKYGIGGNGSISSELLSENQIGSTSTGGSETQSKALPIGSNVSPFSISTANGSYFTICIYTSNNLPKTFWVDSVTLDIAYEIPTYTITAKANNDSYGTVTGGGTYNSGTSVQLTATAKTGYMFKRWSDGNTNATRTITVTGAATYTAEFVKAYSVTFNAKDNWVDQGVITGATEGTYEEGTVLTLTAVPNDGFKFTKWGVVNTTTGGGLTQPTDNPLTLTVTGTIYLYPSFTAVPPEFLSAQLLYSDKQVSQSNKVKAGEGFRIIIDVQ